MAPARRPLPAPLDQPGTPTAELRAAPLFVLASGFSALVYQVLWLRDLGLLFGNTAQASAVGLAVFFAGLAAGAQYWGARSARLRCPLATYGWLELGVAVTAMAGLWLLDLARVVQAPLMAVAAQSSAVLLAANAATAAALLLPPAFLMGGTIPVLGQAVIRHRRHLGRRGALLYGLNTIGAAAGALAAGFLLPPAIGLDGTYGIALGVTALVGVGALWLSAGTRPHEAARPLPAAAPRPLPRLLLVMAAGSGVLMLALEVSAMRLFAQVLQNSIYTFSAVLVAFLLALGAGALIASRLARLRAGVGLVLPALLTMSGLTVAMVPVTFELATGGLEYVAVSHGWHGYIARVAVLVALVIGVPCTVAGTVFPFLLRLAEERPLGAGRTLGALTAWNLAGAIAGSLLTGFVLLPLLGVRGVLTLIPAVYLLGAMVLLARRGSPLPLRLAPVAGLVLLATALNPMQIPLLRVNVAGGERVLHVRESAYGITAVVDREGDRRIRVNNHYSLGGSGAAEYERHQGLLPLLTHPEPRAIFFLGMGTGITAGAAVQPPVDRIVVAELIPDVVNAARRYFRADTNGLFDDPRVTVVTADGRTVLAGSTDRYDLVVADLFVPWEAGTGSLYTREHFRTVRGRLAPGGRFVQWLPLYQMSRHEFMIVARTMLDVFPHVTVWRGDFLADRPIVALTGAVDPAPLDPARIAVHGRRMAGTGHLADRTFHGWALPYYAGNLSQARHLVPEGPVNTDRRPVLEYVAPITHRQQRIGAARWFHAADLLAFFEDLLAALPPEQDPYLARLSPAERELVWKGLRRYAAAVLGTDVPTDDLW